MTQYELPKDFVEPVLLRATVAKILNCTPLTISNREDKGIYPQPARDVKNGYRKYSVLDVFKLQAATYNGKVFLLPVIAVLFDKGYTDLQALNAYVQQVQEQFVKETTKPIQKELPYV